MDTPKKALDIQPIKVAYLSTSVWLSLSQETRAKLAELFGIKRTGTPMTTIGAIGAKVESDGYTPQDLAHISIVKMQEILNTDSTDFYALFWDVVNVVEGKKEEVIGFELVNEASEEAKEIKKRGRPKKHV